jgi:glyoxylase-like metal-dependent hydrolase (beta-lactamase superfamily II)
MVLPGADGSRYPAGTSLVVIGDDATAITDPSITVFQLGGAPVPIDHVVLSHVHEDHIAGLGRFPGATVWAPVDDLVGLRDLDGLLEMYGMDEGAAAQEWQRMLIDDFHYTPRPDARALPYGEVLDLGGVTLRLDHLPGHTRGHSAVVVEAPGDDTVAYVGDIDLSSFGPYYGDAWSDLEAFTDSLRRVRGLQARWYVTFHHKGIVEGHEAFVDEVDRFAAVIDDRERRLLAFLDQARTLDDIVAHRFIYRPGVELPFVNSVERRSMAMHLRRLEAAGRVSRRSDSWIATGG